MNKFTIELTTSVVRGIAVATGFGIGYKVLSKEENSSFNPIEKFFRTQAMKVGAVNTNQINDKWE